MRSIKIIFFSLLFVLTLFFIFQNTAVMQITFLFWSVSMSACLILLITFFSGFMLGGLVELLKVRKKAQKAGAFCAGIFNKPYQGKENLG